MKRPNPAPVVPKLLKVSAAARYLGVSRNFIQRLLDEQALPCVRLDGYKIRLVASDLDAWVQENRTYYERAKVRNTKLGKPNTKEKHDYDEGKNRSPR